ncbi:hypothetical protein Anas_06681 [Armadillidium nasatum]|uniref:Uncharacterized protein n=1 Tax=Armadillidium nasatum TaxID=96803 RepID=A0A5N5SHI1_9CRUS|nr:hypothetical protein Anas_06681 [Armadillidium nasatum]
MEKAGHDIVTNFLGNIGILKVIPRECSTTSTFLGKGMCSLESTCTQVGGAIAGECDRAGVCCVVPAVCGSTIGVKRSWFVNKEFPGAISESYAEDCVLRIQKSEETVI